MKTELVKKHMYVSSQILILEQSDCEPLLMEKCSNS